MLTLALFFQLVSGKTYFLKINPENVDTTIQVTCPGDTDFEPGFMFPVKINDLDKDAPVVNIPFSPCAQAAAILGKSKEKPAPERNAARLPDDSVLVIPPTGIVCESGYHFGMKNIIAYNGSISGEADCLPDRPAASNENADGGGPMLQERTTSINGRNFVVVYYIPNKQWTLVSPLFDNQTLYKAWVTIYEVVGGEKKRVDRPTMGVWTEKGREEDDPVRIVKAWMDRAKSK